MHAIQRTSNTSLARLSRLLLSVHLLLALGCASTSSTTGQKDVEEPKATSEQTKAKSADANQKTVSLEPVYFDTDDARIRGDARRALNDYAAAILDHPEWGVVTIEGHCDERGNDAYNYALGQRRADSVKRFLVAEGVPADRIATRTLGSDRPTVSGHDERAWGVNRRSEMRTDTLVSTNF